MCNSSPEGKPQAVQRLRELPIRSVLDVGVGMAAWHDYLGPVWPDAVWDGIEIWAPYVEEFHLLRRYRKVLVGDAYDLAPTIVEPYDLVIYGDVLEHMTKERAINTVLTIPSTYALISLPIIEYPQGPGPDGNPYETHVATWTAKDVLDAFPVVWHWAGREIGVFLLEHSDLQKLPG